MRLLIVLFVLTLTSSAVAADWQPIERVDSYTIEGGTGIELYRSIGDRGPKIGIGRAIAYTDFELTWTRDYRPQADGACVLAVARPRLVITYRLPEAPDDLSGPVAARWERFITGIAAHEKVHGRYIVEMVEQIADFSLGLSAPDDPGCQKVRQVLQARLGELSREQRRRGSDFDRAEMAEGGNIHQLVLGLVNGF